MTAAKNLSLKCLWEWMKNERGLLLFAFVLVFLKKWEPGGHIDATWYSAVARNIAEKGDFFHFYINPFFANEVFDHFPLDYWIMGGLMSLFGVSDFIARLYFMICSFASLLFLFGIARQIFGRTYGYITLIVFALCFGATKWSGAIKHDVPLTMSYLACTYFFLKSFKQPLYLLAVAPFFALGVFSKGPVAFGFPLAVGIWSLIFLKFQWMRSKEFFGTLILSSPLCSSSKVGLWEAFFTSTSAITVTGLSIIDIGVDLGGVLAYDSIHEKCEQLHTGGDGVSKTWTEVEVLVKVPISRN